MTDSLLSNDWLQKLSSYSTLWVGYSGGLDSTVLLHSLSKIPELVLKLQAVHVHHGLSVNADTWQAHCQTFCENLSIPLHIRPVVLNGSANIEEGARIARYGVFSSLLSDNDGLLLAHHKDDQAETLLLQLFRGAGIDGMSAMNLEKKFAKGMLLRPFLDYSRKILEAYALRHQLAWVEDESNQNPAFSRNYLRHQIMPLIQHKWPSVVNQLVQSAGHCQQATTNLDTLADIDYETLSEQGDTLNIEMLKTLARPRLVNVLRVWIKNNQVRPLSLSLINQLIDEVIGGGEDKAPLIQWGGMLIRRFRQTLYLLKNEVNTPLNALEWPTFPRPLKLGASGYCLYARPHEQGLTIAPGKRVQVRFRRGGEIFYWHGQHKQLKKLWQQWAVPPWKRDNTPLLYIDNELVAVVGFAVSDYYYSKEFGITYVIDSQVADHF